MTEPTEHHFVVPPGVKPPGTLSSPMSRRPPTRNLVLGSILVGVGALFGLGNLVNVLNGTVAANLRQWPDFVWGYVLGIVIILGLLVWGAWLLRDYALAKRRIESWRKP